jgi:type VI secretion system protein ImpM
MNVTSDVARIPGWYGKLPSLGDFASRRLEADFIEPWDLWLGEGLQAQRGTFGEGWLDAYLGAGGRLAIGGDSHVSVDPAERPASCAVSDGVHPRSDLRYQLLCARPPVLAVSG